MLFCFPPPVGPNAKNNTGRKAGGLGRQGCSRRRLCSSPKLMSFYNSCGTRVTSKGPVAPLRAENRDDAGLLVCYSTLAAEARPRRLFDRIGCVGVRANGDGIVCARRNIAGHPYGLQECGSSTWPSSQQRWARRVGYDGASRPSRGSSRLRKLWRRALLLDEH